MAPPLTSACGLNPRPLSHGSRPEYDVSRCPLNIRLLPPPEPSSTPRTLGRPSSTSCQVTCSPSPTSVSATYSAMRCSDPVGLGMSTRSDAVSTSRLRSTRGSAIAEMRDDLLPEEPDLLQPVVAPELEHDVRAAGV